MYQGKLRENGNLNHSICLHARHGLVIRPIRFLIKAGRQAGRHAVRHAATRLGAEKVARVRARRRRDEPRARRQGRRVGRLCFCIGCVCVCGGCGGCCVAALPRGRQPARRQRQVARLAEGRGGARGALRRDRAADARQLSTAFTAFGITTQVRISDASQ